MSDVGSNAPQDCNASAAVSRELLWFEGCILLLLVDHRQSQRLLTDAEAQQQQQQPAHKSVPQKLTPPRTFGHGLDAAGSGVGGSPARSLAAQMIRSLASEKAALQRKLENKLAPSVGGTSQCDLS